MEQLPYSWFGESREDGVCQLGVERAGFQPLVIDRPQEGQTAEQRRVRHQWRQQRVLHVCHEQRLQRRHRLARRRMLPRKVVRLREFRGASELCRQHQPRHSLTTRSRSASTG